MHLLAWYVIVSKATYVSIVVSLDQTSKKDILVVQGNWNAKVGRDACGTWQGICGPFCNNDTN